MDINRAIISVIDRLSWSSCPVSCLKSLKKAIYSCIEWIIRFRCSTSTFYRQIFRFLQSALIFVAGEMYLSSTLVYGHGGLTLVGRAYQFDKLSGLLGRSRKLFRLSRARPLSQDLYPTYSTLKGQKCPCSFLEMLFGFMGDICNVSFFITDAYTNLYMVP